MECFTPRMALPLIRLASLGTFSPLHGEKGAHQIFFRTPKFFLSPSPFTARTMRASRPKGLTARGVRSCVRAGGPGAEAMIAAPSRSADHGGPSRVVLPVSSAGGNSLGVLLRAARKAVRNGPGSDLRKRIEHSGKSSSARVDGKKCEPSRGHAKQAYKLRAKNRASNGVTAAKVRRDAGDSPRFRFFYQHSSGSGGMSGIPRRLQLKEALQTSSTRTRQRCGPRAQSRTTKAMHCC